MFKLFADFLSYQLFNLPRGERLSESLNFFLYDIPKIYFLLIITVFAVAIIRSFLPPERIRKVLSHEREFFGNITAASLGIFTPFCTCSAIPFAVIIAVIMGVPLYSNAAGTIPVVQVLMEKGLALGTTLAFMLAVTSLSLPEFIILRKVLKPRLLLTFFGTVAIGIILAGSLFNLVFYEKMSWALRLRSGQWS